MRRARGAALLLVVSAVAVLMPLCVALSSSIATAKLSRSVEQREATLDVLLHAADAPIQRWLAEVAPTLVLPPDARTPSVVVLEDSVALRDGAARLRVVAWDQRGLVPLSLASGASLLRLGLPTEFVRAADRVARRAGRPGLDWFVRGDSALPFPTERGSELGASIAAVDGATLNVNTAPLERVEAALRELGRSGADRIAAARHAGELASVPGPAAGEQSDERRRSDRGDEHGSSPTLQLVSTSDCFAFRIDAEFGRAQRSWWSVYRPHDGKWRLEQRLLIPNG